eukprot:1926340-Rhodomonas_salina.2
MLAWEVQVFLLQYQGLAESAGEVGRKMRPPLLDVGGVGVYTSAVCCPVLRWAVLQAIASKCFGYEIAALESKEEQRFGERVKRGRDSTSRRGSSDALTSRKSST